MAASAMRLPRFQRNFVRHRHKRKEVRILKNKKTPSQPKEVIAIRKSCKTTGTGLSHYVMMEAPKR